MPGTLLNPFRTVRAYQGPYTTTLTLLDDTFTRADSSTIGAGSSGPAATEQNGDSSIVSNNLRLPSTAEVCVGWLALGYTTYSFTFTIGPTLGPQPIACARYQNNLNFVGFQINNGTTGVYKRVGGTYTQLTSTPTTASVAWATGDVGRIDVTPTAVTLFRQAGGSGSFTQVLTATDSTLNTQDGVGFRATTGISEFADVRVTTSITAPRPTIRLSGSVGGTSLTIPTVRVGEMLLISFSQRAAAPTLGGVSGLTSLGAPNNQSSGNSNQQYTHGYWKICDGTESGATFSLTGTSASCVISYAVVAPQYEGTLAIDASSQCATDVNVGSRALPTVSSATSDDLIVYLTGARNSSSLASSVISNINVTTLQSPADGSSGIERGILAYDLIGSATTARTVTNANTSGTGGWTVAIKETS